MFENCCGRKILLWMRQELVWAQRFVTKPIKYVWKIAHFGSLLPGLQQFTYAEFQCITNNILYSDYDFIAVLYQHFLIAVGGKFECSSNALHKLPSKSTDGHLHRCSCKYLMLQINTEWKRFGPFPAHIVFFLITLNKIFGYIYHLMISFDILGHNVANILW